MSSGGLAIAVAGVLDNAHVLSGGSLILLGPIASGTVVDAGGTVLSSGIAFLSGMDVTSASSPTLSGNTVMSGRAEYVLSGGSAIAALVASGGALNVESAGSAAGTQVASGGRMAIALSGTANATHIAAGGVLTVLGVVSGTVVAGFGIVSGVGGTLKNVSIHSGGVVSADDTVSGGTVSAGGVLNLVYGGVVDGLNVQSGGFLVLSGYSAAKGVALQVGASIDAWMVAYGSATSASINYRNILTIQGDVKPKDLVGLTGNYAGDTFVLTADGHGGTLVTLAAAGMTFVAGAAPVREAGDPWQAGGLALQEMYGGGDLVPRYGTVSAVMPVSAVAAGERGLEGVAESLGALNFVWHAT